MAGEYAFLAILAAVSSLLVFGGLAWALRRREWPFRVALALLALALLASVVPAPTPPGYALLSGELAGDATLPVARDTDAPLSVTGGQGAFVDENLTLHCAAHCSFSAGTKELRFPPYKRGVSLGGDARPTAQLQGSIRLEDRHGACFAVPLLIATLVPGSACAACSLTEFEGNASGPLREGLTRGC